MDEFRKNLILNISLGKISKDEFIKKFPVEIDAVEHQLYQLLKDGLNNRSASDVECAMLFGFNFGFSELHGILLCDILREKWHMQHENIVLVLQKMKFSFAIDDIYEAAISEFSYLEYDESYALGIKCEYALKSIGGEDARIKLELLAKSSNNILAENALKLLNSWVGNKIYKM